MSTTKHSQVKGIKLLEAQLFNTWRSWGFHWWLLYLAQMRNKPQLHISTSWAPVMKWWVCEKPVKAPGWVGRRGQLSRILCFDWSPVLPRSEKWSFRSCHSVMRGRNFEWQHLPRAKYFFRDEPCSQCCIVFLHQIRLTMDQKRANNGPKRPPPPIA